MNKIGNRHKKQGTLKNILSRNSISFEPRCGHVDRSTATAHSGNLYKDLLSRNNAIQKTTAHYMNTFESQILDFEKQVTNKLTTALSAQEMLDIRKA